ncbi:hypothetical protein BGX26_004510, partial [Mortierella sp. AD094]
MASSRCMNKRKLNGRRIKDLEDSSKAEVVSTEPPADLDKVMYNFSQQSMVN